MYKLILTALLFLPFQLLAESGGLDSYGCHNETATGTYHCHEGKYPGLTFDSMEEALSYFTFWEAQTDTQSIIINTSIGLYKVSTVTGTLHSLRSIIEDQVWFTGDNNSPDLAYEFTIPVGAHLGSPNEYPFDLSDSQGPFFVIDIYNPFIPLEGSLGFGATFWSPYRSVGAGLSTTALEQDIYTYAVANALPTVTIVGGDRTIPDTNGEPGEIVSFELRASDTDGTISEISYHVETLSGEIVGGISTSSSSPGQSSNTLYAARQIPDGQFRVVMSATDNDGATNATSAIITVLEPNGEPPNNPVISIVGDDGLISDSDGIQGELVGIEIAYGNVSGPGFYTESWKIDYPDRDDLEALSLIIPTANSTNTVEWPLSDGINLITYTLISRAGVEYSDTVQIIVEGPNFQLEYDRDDYLTTWGDFDGDCIDTRHEVLAIESLVEPIFDEDGCRVVSGLWYDPYTDQTFTNPSDLDIDHLVPLKEAHDSGARYWLVEDRKTFANDTIIADALIAVEASANQLKGANDPALWLPPNQEFHCEYVRDWVAVKKAYGLDFDEDEILAIETVLGDELNHATGVTRKGIFLDGNASYASFSLGINRNGGCPYYTEATTEDLLSISLNIIPEAEHIGREFDLFIIAQIDAQLYTLTPEGSLVPIDADPDQLIAFRSDVFKESYELGLFEGFLSPTIAYLFIAYWPQDGALIYTPAPIRLEIE